MSGPEHTLTAAMLMTVKGLFVMACAFKQRLSVFVVLPLTLVAGQAGALTLSECVRTTHISHGGEAKHRDMGEGRVAWLDWWSNEGIADRIFVVECASGEALYLLTAEERMSDRLPFRKTEKAEQILEQQHEGARVFATLSRIADAMKGTARDIELFSITEEPCACAALYADLRGDKTPFELRPVTPLAKTRKDP